jgi:ADP-ribosyl-[dinitrogen reductase] hydrolase
VVTLLEPTELTDLAACDLGKEVRRRFMEWHHWPIADALVPDTAFEEAWPERSARLRALLDAGARNLIHCQAYVVGLPRSDPRRSA